MIERAGEEGLKAYIQAYLASVAFADAQLGIILDALEHSVYADNTIIIETSDHGKARVLPLRMSLMEKGTAPVRLGSKHYSIIRSAPSATGISFIPMGRRSYMIIKRMIWKDSRWQTKNLTVK